MTIQALLPVLAELGPKGALSASLDELARAAQRSPSHFQRAFTRLMGESPKRHQRRLRLEAGAVRLLSSDDGILEIALEVGFDSHEGFTRAFCGHFGRSPRAFRRRWVGVSPVDRVRHGEVVTHVGPCLHLFRVPLDDRGTKPFSRAKAAKIMSYDITKQSLPEQTVLFVAAKCRPDELQATMAKCLPAAYGHAMRNGIAMTGPPFTRYLSMGPGLISLQGGVPVVSGATGAGEVEVGTLEACDAAVMIYQGAYDGLGDAHAAVQSWIEAEGHTPGGPPWEVYLTDPGEVPDPSDWKTQIVWPLA